MSGAISTTASGCPACVAAPPAGQIADAGKKRVDDAAEISLSLPTIHCAGCISTVERVLNGTQGVLDARVNLSLKRVRVRAGDGLTAETLVRILEGAGYEAHELDAGQLTATQTDRAGRDLLMRLAVAGFAMMNVMLLSVAVWSGAEAATRDLFHWISAAIALPTIAFSAQPFYSNAWAAVSARRLNMDVPISLAILLAAAMSLYETTQSGHHAYFDAALSLTFFLLAGRYLDHRTRAVARSAAQELAALEVPRAEFILTDGNTEKRPVAALSPGDKIRVRPGGRIPADGVIASGTSDIDRSLLTGETMPVLAQQGQKVSAGEVNLTGPLDITVSAAGRDSSLSRMAELVAASEGGRNRYTSLADWAARIYAPGVHLLALFAFVGWLWAAGDVRLALNIAVAVLIITCPCALGLAVPAVTTAASGRLFRKGMLIKDGTALERLAEIDTVVFDKTGTLTQGAPKPTNLSDHTPSQLAVAAALAAQSSHPMAQALAAAIAERGIQPAALSDIREVPGHGVQAILGKDVVRLGRAEWLGATAGENSATWLQIGSAAAAEFTFSDSLRHGAREAVAELVRQGKDVHLVSGDARAPVQAMARSLGISSWHAATLPEEKAAFVRALSDDGHKVLMVGDGLNDTAALAAAHVSLSPASALDAARVAADIVLLGQSLAPLGDAAATARKATRRILENFAIAAAYNAVAIPVALLGFATPLAAALAMSASSITVSLNALRLR